MPTPLPTPLAAALGVVPTVLTGVRRLPGKAFSLPMHAISTTLNTLDALRREYVGLAERGEQFATWLRGGADELAEDVSERADVVEDRVSDFAARTSVSAAYGKVEDALEEASRTVGRRAGATLRAVTDEDVVGQPGAAAADEPAGFAAPTRAADQAADAAAEQPPAAEQPKGFATPRATEPDSTRVDTAASADVVRVVEQTVPDTAAVPQHDDLPLPDYDHMTLGSLRGRLRSLSVDQLGQIRAYEKAHADRLPVVTMLDNRIAKLATDASAAPSGPVSLQPAPEQLAAAGATAGSTVSPATTNAPVINPPSQGDPTNPSQPR